MSRPQRSLRLEKRSSRSLSVLSGAPGEIFFDNDNGTLRVYTDTDGDSIILANRQWVTANTFDGDYNKLTNRPTIPPTVDLTGLATETYVDDAIGNISASGFVQFGSLTSTERDALTAANGMVIYNTTNNKFEGYQNGAWINLDNGTAAS